MPLNPDLESFLELVQLGDSQPMHLQTPAAARASYDAATPMLDAPGAEAVATQDLSLPCPGGRQIGARLYSPPATEALPCLLFFHGGGFCIGGLDSHDALCRDLAERTPCKVLAVDYRLAPEHKFPAAFDDAFDAWNWLRRHAASHGIDGRRLAAGGDSAGGTLATALCIALKQAGEQQPALQVLIYPCTSSQQNSLSHQRHGSGYLLEAATLQWMFTNYLNHEDERNDWRFAPLAASDVSGLAPAHIVLAEYDPLLDEGVAYATKLRDAGVPATLKIYPGMVHDFARLGNIVDDAAILRDDLARVLSGVFAGAAFLVGETADD
ncbi:alpha/beta hydrolase [Massilia sp. NR 4-1]|uniref:alpha/beta hydrolase n=1 Tax=Massilia sp. NR 4-1 TaxID=1678028 RepID=UPI00067DE17D|nr:alpha/beta hydrolase [Massilia sp. NR 4-1]AKU24710.1 esterase [Massilia sp. NR 4-1]